MYIHLGKDVTVNSKDIVGIFDIDKSTIGKITRDFLSKAQKSNIVVNVSEELPKSFVVCSKDDENIVYISQISPGTLLKRALDKSV